MAEDPKPRYAVIPGSVSAHCCFDFTVVDTHFPTLCNGVKLREYTTVCECFDEEDAKKIVAALNRGIL